MVSLRSREVDSDSQATSARTRSLRTSGGHSTFLADTAQTPSRRSARLQRIQETAGESAIGKTFLCLLAQGLVERDMAGPRKYGQQVQDAKIGLMHASRCSRVSVESSWHLGHL